MPQSPRSPWNPSPCTKDDELRNWQSLHRLLGRVPLEPTEDDDGKLLQWNNMQKRFILVSPCTAVVGCGDDGSGGCATPCEHASGVTPLSKTVTFGGAATPTGCDQANAVVTGSPYVLVCDGPCKYTYLDPDFMCNGMASILAVTIDVFPTESILTLSIGALTGGVVWKKTGLSAPFDLATAINGSYSLHENLSTQGDFGAVTATVSA